MQFAQSALLLHLPLLSKLFQLSCPHRTEHGRHQAGNFIVMGLGGTYQLATATMKPDHETLLVSTHEATIF